VARILSRKISHNLISNSSWQLEYVAVSSHVLAWEWRGLEWEPVVVPLVGGGGGIWVPVCCSPHATHLSLAWPSQAFGFITHDLECPFKTYSWKIRGSFFLFFFLKILLRERTSVWERQSETEKQDPCWVGNPMRGSIPGPRDHDLSRRQTPNDWATQALPPLVLSTFAGWSQLALDKDSESVGASGSPLRAVWPPQGTSSNV